MKGGLFEKIKLLKTEVINDAVGHFQSWMKKANSGVQKVVTENDVLFD